MRRDVFEQEPLTCVWRRTPSNRGEECREDQGSKRTTRSAVISSYLGCAALLRAGVGDGRRGGQTGRSPGGARSAGNSGQCHP